MKILLLVVGAFMIIGTLLPLIKKDNWWIRAFDFPRLQIAFIQGVTIVAFLPFVVDSGLMDKLFWIALHASLYYQCYMMFSYTPFAKKQVEQSRQPANDDTISLLFANVLMENRKSAELINLIRDADPDIILTAEVNDWWVDQLKDLEQRYPNTVYHPQGNHYGMALFSKLELVNTEVKFLVEDDIPSIHTQARLRSGKLITLRCLHPEPPFINGDSTSTDRDAELLIVGKELKNSDQPSVVFGDLNDVAWSRTNYLFQDISGLLDPRVGRGFFNTFHTEYLFLRFPLDHAFHTNHFKLHKFKRLEYFGSDHFPVYIELNLEPGAEHTQDEPEADTSEQQEADEKIENGINNNKD